MKRLRDVRRADAIDILDGIVDRGAPFTANRALAVLTRLGNWAVEREIIAASPFDRIKPPAVETSRERVLSDDEIKLVWAAFEAVGHPFGAFGKLLLLTGARRAEVAGMRWSEVDLAARAWTLPGARTKNGREHVVPLSDAAVRVLQDLPRIGDKPDGFIFTTTGRTSVSGYSHAKAAIDRAISAEIAERGHFTTSVERSRPTCRSLASSLRSRRRYSITCREAVRESSASTSATHGPTRSARP